MLAFVVAETMEPPLHADEIDEFEFVVNRILLLSPLVVKGLMFI